MHIFSQIKKDSGKNERKLMLSTSHRQPEVIIRSQSIINLNMSIKENCPLITHVLVRKPEPRQSERNLNIPQTLWACQTDGIIISKVEGRAISSRVSSSPRNTHIQLVGVKSFTSEMKACIQRNYSLLRRNSAAPASGLRFK